jgi:hypothetical protein
MKDNLLNSACQKPTSCMGCDCYLMPCILTLIKLVCTVSCHQSALLGSCNTVASKLQVTCSCDVITIERLRADAFSMQSSCDLVPAQWCTWPVNQYVVIQQQLLSGELFSKLPIHILLICHCNRKWSLSFRPDCYWNWILSSHVKKEHHPSHSLSPLK